MVFVSFEPIFTDDSMYSFWKLTYNLYKKLIFYLLFDSLFLKY